MKSLLVAALTMVPTPYPGPSPLQWELNQIREKSNLPWLGEKTELALAAAEDAKAFHEAALCESHPPYEMVACGFDKAEDVLAYWLKDPVVSHFFLSNESLAIGSARYKNTWVLISE